MTAPDRYWIECLDDDSLITLGKNRSQFVALWDLREARRLKTELEAAIVRAETLEKYEDR